MRRLQTWTAEAPSDKRLDTTDARVITALLGVDGVGYQRFSVPSVDPDAPDDTLLGRVGPWVSHIADVHQLRTTDVVRLRPDSPGYPVLRPRFATEHTHDEPELRAFLDGGGVFWFRAATRVHRLDCEAGDLIALPAGIPHAFDAGPAPRFTAIRWFSSPAGWVATPTGSALAAHFEPLP